MTVLSNTMSDLAERVKEVDAAAMLAARTSIEKAMEAGELLCAARAEAKHGEWRKFLERAGVKERRAQQYMQLCRSGLKAATVADLGGIRIALEWLATLPPPPPEGSHLVISLDRFSHEMSEPFVVVAAADDGNVWVYRFDLSADQPWWEQPRRSVRSEYLWPVVFTLLDHRALDMTFGFVPIPESPLEHLI